MPSIVMHANNNCLIKYVEKRKKEMSNMPVNKERTIFPLLLDSLNANMMNVKDSAITIHRIFIIPV
jgi:hypothetical protein